RHSLLKARGMTALRRWCSTDTSVPEDEYNWSMQSGEFTGISGLPLFQHRERIVDSLVENDVTVVMAPTGCGK
ncbi:hypothetical protein PFISCL1PPCAC_21713, partial [Pristionchus fissidentatus]